MSNHSKCTKLRNYSFHLWNVHKFTIFGKSYCHTFMYVQNLLTIYGISVATLAYKLIRWTCIESIRYGLCTNMPTKKNLSTYQFMLLLIKKYYMFPLCKYSFRIICLFKKYSPLHNAHLYSSFNEYKQRP